MKNLIRGLSVLLLATIVMAGTYKPVPINNQKWNLWNRAVGTLPLNNVPGNGVWFDFPVSPLPDPDATPPWAGYLITSSGKAPTIIGTEIVVTFQVEASEGVLWNFKSDGDGNPGTTPANFHVYVQRGTLWSGEAFARWWSNPVSYTMADSGGVITLTVPIDPGQWSDVNGIFGDDPNWPGPNGATAGFLESFHRPTYIGITFGGGSFFGHGVNVSDGTARFTLLGWTAR